jgi:hypothetical protein
MKEQKEKQRALEQAQGEGRSMKGRTTVHPVGGGSRWFSNGNQYITGCM